MGLLEAGVTLQEVRVSSDPNLILKLLRKLGSDLQQFRVETNERLDRVETRLDTLEHTVAGMAATCSCSPTS